MPARRGQIRFQPSQEWLTSAELPMASPSIDNARDSFGTFQRAQERAVAYTVLAHENVLTRSAQRAP